MAVVEECQGGLVDLVFSTGNLPLQPLAPPATCRYSCTFLRWDASKKGREKAPERTTALHPTPEGKKMARFKVTRSEKSRNGRIVGLSGPSFTFRSTDEIISDLREGRHQYYVREAPFESNVKVVEEDGKPAIRTTKNVLSRNHLGNLPPQKRSRWTP